nr:DUF2730 family protein [Brucella anthropi]
MAETTETEVIDISAIQPWTSVIATIISIGAAVYAVVTSGAKKNAATLDDHEHRISTIENDLKHLPSKESFYQLQIDMTELKGQIGTITKSSEATERTVRRVEDFLLKKGQ